MRHDRYEYHRFDTRGGLPHYPQPETFSWISRVGAALVIGAMLCGAYALLFIVR